MTRRHAATSHMPLTGRRGPVWSEAEGRAAVAARSLGRCELCGAPDPEWAHRKGRGRGGLWSPANGCHLCRRCHDVLTHDHPLAAAGGWEVSTHADPTLVPVFLVTPEGLGWWRLTDEEGLHRHVPLDDGERARRGFPAYPWLPAEVLLVLACRLCDPFAPVGDGDRCVCPRTCPAPTCDARVAGPPPVGRLGHRADAWKRAHGYEEARR